jgi:hypothetical protein
MSGAIVAAGISGAISLAEYITTTVKMYQQKSLTEKQLLSIIAIVVQDTTAANLTWEKDTNSPKEGGV